MTALGVIGIVLLCIIAVPVILFLIILLILSFKTRLIFKISPEEKEFWVKHAFFEKRLYPFPPKREKKPQKEKKAKPAEEKKPSEKKKSGIGDTVMAKVKALTLPDYLEFIKLFHSKFISRIKFEKLWLKVKVGTPSADTTARRYGELNAIVFPLLGRLDSAGRIKDGDVKIWPDFACESTEVWADVDVSLRIINILSWAMKVVFIILTK